MIFLIGAILFITTSAFAQQPKLSKEERRAQRRAALEESYEENREIILDRRFAIEANRFADRYGRQYFLNSNANFIMADGENGVIQLAFNNGPGYNGLGGITLQGRVTKFTVHPRKNGALNTTGRMVVSGTALGAVDIFFNVNGEGNASFRVSSSYGHRFTLYGFITHLEDTVLYQGLTTF